MSISSDSKTVAAIVLAAGSSRRMGARNKLLEPVMGEPMVKRCTLAVTSSDVHSVTLVTGYEEQRVREAVNDLAITVVHNADFENGLSRSLRAGITSLPAVDGAMIVLADMPLLESHHFNILLSSFIEHAAEKIIVPEFNSQRGNPVIWPCRYFPMLIQLQGDSGARELLKQYARHVHRVAVDSRAVCVDVDTLQALQDVTQTIVTE